MLNTPIKKLRYIDLGLIEPSFIQSIWEYPNLVSLTMPTIFVYSPNKDTIGNMGYEELGKKINIERLPKDIGFYRVKGKDAHPFLINQDVVLFILHYPDIESFNVTDKAIKAIIFKVLKSRNIPIFWKNNDIYFLKDGMEKKFFGILNDFSTKDRQTILFNITFDFNSELANELYKFDDIKFTKKGDVVDISKIVGGIYEVNPDIDKNEIAIDVIQKIAERFGLEIEHKGLSEVELSKMNKLVDKFNNKEWHIHGKRP